MDPAQQIQAGDFFLTTIDGFWPNTLVRLGQAACGDWSPYSHAALYVGGPDRLALEMAPGGIAVRPFSDFAGRPLAVSSWPLDLDERDKIVSEAWGDYQRQPPIRYGWPNYPIIGMARLGIRPAWARRYLADQWAEICSQWIDDLYRRAPVELFADGRLSGLVSPGSLTGVLSQPKTV